MNWNNNTSVLIDFESLMNNIAIDRSTVTYFAVKITKTTEIMETRCQLCDKNGRIYCCWTWSKNKIAQGDVRIFSHFFLRKILVLLRKYCQIRYLRVRISGNRYFTCPFQNKFKNVLFGGHFVSFSKTRLAITSKVINRFCLFSKANTGRSFTNMS